MRIALFGGTGRVGGRLLREALSRRHTVQALVRDTSKLVERDGLTVIAGDVLRPDDLADAVRGCDAALAALGGRGTARSAGMRNIAAALQSAGISRIVALAGGGILDAPGGGLRRDRPDYPAFFRAVSEEHLGTWEALRETPLTWTIFCPPDIPDRDATGVFRTEIDRMPDGPGREIAAGDLANAMLDALEQGAFARSRVGIKGT